MFTGIIESLGELKKQNENRFTFSHHFDEPFILGESISLTGMCASIIDFDEQNFTVEIMAESRNKTIFENIKVGDQINLERAAHMNARNSGHFVTGHIDEVGGILKLEPVEDYSLLRISVSSENAKYMVNKGTIAINGISLTISRLGENYLEVSIISHTWTHTNLQNLKVGGSVNLEFDLLGKYILRAYQLENL
jgi:riboflavin synthase